MNHRSRFSRRQQCAKLFNSVRVPLNATVRLGIQFRQIRQRVFGYSPFSRKPIAKRFGGGQIVVYGSRRFPRRFRVVPPMVHIGRRYVRKRPPAAIVGDNSNFGWGFNHVFITVPLRLQRQPPVFKMRRQRLP
ncbi:MAG: hypothetical protein LBT97_11305 [Planctomycetota bacterium]|nr:hypothetical protein [Planctomycetota bacterium]